MGIKPHTAPGRLHHLEIWVQDYDRAKQSLGWLLEELGYTLASEWGHGGSWQGAEEYIVLESGPDVAGPHERRRAGLNHLALAAGPASNVDALADAALGHWWPEKIRRRPPRAPARNSSLQILDENQRKPATMVQQLQSGIRVMDAPLRISGEWRSVRQNDVQGVCLAGRACHELHRPLLPGRPGQLGGCLGCLAAAGQQMPSQLAASVLGKV